MTNREVLLATRAIVADGEPERNRSGCLEDGLCRTVYGISWFARHDSDILAELKSHPAYKLLLVEAQKRMPGLGPWLWGYNDHVTKAERLALIDTVIDSL